METKKSDRFTLTERDRVHEKLMIALLKQLSVTPLVLKGGTALYLGFGLNRFSEDLDFDSDKKLNLINRIKHTAVHGIVIEGINIKKDTDTVSRYIIQYAQSQTGRKDSLKLEISYRTPVANEHIIVKDGIRFSNLPRIIDNKLHAAFDGDNTRIKGRDLFDLHFLATHYPHHFNADLAVRLTQFASDPEKLVVLYQDDVQSDPILNKIMDVELIALELYTITQHWQNN